METCYSSKNIALSKKESKLSIVISRLAIKKLFIKQENERQLQLDMFSNENGKQQKKLLPIVENLNKNQIL